jgi:hypothetical protein
VSAFTLFVLCLRLVTRPMESPKWLIEKKRYQDAVNVIQRVRIYNQSVHKRQTVNCHNADAEVGSLSADDLEKRHMEIHEPTLAIEKSKDRHDWFGLMKSLFRSRTHLIGCICIWTIWLMISVAFKLFYRQVYLHPTLAL